MTTGLIDSELTFEEFGSTVLVRRDDRDNSVRLEIDQMWFSRKDLKKLINDLKTIRKEMKQ